MIQPRTGFLWGKSRADAVKHTPPLFFAHSDMSGLSLFEEAHFRGVEGAKGIVQFLGGAKQAEAIS
jgi:hypothetical protein